MADKAPNMQRHMDAAYDRYKAAANGPGRSWDKQEFWDQLSAEERIAVFCGNMNYQVENGGWNQWFENGYATEEVMDFITRTNKRLGTEAAKEVNNLLQKFRELLGEYGMSDPRNVSESDWEEYSADCDPLNAAFYEINDQWLDDIEKLFAPAEDPRAAWERVKAEWDAAHPEAAELDVADLAYSREADICALAQSDPEAVKRLLDRAYQDIEQP